MPGAVGAPVGLWAPGRAPAASGSSPAARHLGGRRRSAPVLNDCSRRVSFGDINRWSHPDRRALLELSGLQPFRSGVADAVLPAVDCARVVLRVVVVEHGSGFRDRVGDGLVARESLSERRDAGSDASTSANFSGYRFSIARRPLRTRLSLSRLRSLCTQKRSWPARTASRSLRI